MEREVQQQQALALCRQLKGKTLCYCGEDRYYRGQCGQLEVWYDQNCCAPTQDVLFAFVGAQVRRVMSAQECLSFLRDCQIVPQS